MFVHRFTALSFCLGLVATVLLSTSAHAGGIVKGHWYQDPFFPSPSQPSHYTVSPSASVQQGVPYFSQSQVADSMPCVLTSGALSSAHCPPPTNAILKLWVPDGLHVEVNGYVTKPQQLAGRHRHSRIFSLEGLEASRFSPCNVVVHQHNPHGKLIKYHHGLSVRTGGHYEARYPHDFKPIPRSAPGPGHPHGHPSPHIQQHHSHVARVGHGLEALYRFDENGGTEIIDHSKKRSPLNLHIGGSVRWVHPRGLAVISRPRIVSSAPAHRLIQAVKKSKAITIEAWIYTDAISQSGPARIVTLSADTTNRNITLGQDGDKFQVRLRTTAKPRNLNGLGGNELESHSGSVEKKLMHVVYTRDHHGMARLYVDGKQVSSKIVPGDFWNWQDYHLLLASERSRHRRDWIGTYYLVAIYSRALSDKELMQNFRAGF